MARMDLASGMRSEPVTSGHPELRTKSKVKRRKLTPLPGGEVAVFARLGERPRRRGAVASRGRVLTPRQRWF